MKKTLVALAAIAATTGAMADVTISGWIDQALNTTTTTDSSGAKTSTQSVGHNAIGQDLLVFGVSEDIGGGLKASATFAYLINTSAAYSGVAQDAGSGIGLSGGFGSIKLGTDWDQVFYTASTADASGWGIGVGNMFGSNVMNRQAQTIAYTLPPMVEGLTAVLERSYNSTTGDSTGFSLGYSSGPFMIKYASRTTAVSATPGQFTKTTVDGTIETNTTGGGLPDEAYEGNPTTNAVALTYDLGTAKLYYGNLKQTVSNASTQAENSDTIGVTVPIDSFSIGYAYSTSKFTNAANESHSQTGSRLLAKYAFSKRTSAYIQWGRAKETGALTAATGSGLGLTHNF